MRFTMTNNISKITNFYFKKRTVWGQSNLYDDINSSIYYSKQKASCYHYSKCLDKVLVKTLLYIASFTPTAARCI